MHYRCVFCRGTLIPCMVFAMAIWGVSLETAPLAAQVNRITVQSFRPPEDVLPGHIVHDLFIDFEGQYTGSQLFVELEDGSIFQHPVSGYGRPGQFIIDSDPSAAFDTFITIGPSAGPFPGPQPVFPVCVTTPCTPLLKFDTEGISIGWNPAPGTLIVNGSDFHVARVTLAEDAQGSIRYLGFAAGAGPLVNYSPIVNGHIERTLVVGGLAGDYNGSGQVEQADLDLVLLHWGHELIDPAKVGWLNDPPSGIVDQQHLDKVLLGWGNSAALSSTASATVPEPSTLALMAVLIISLVVLGCRRESATGGAEGPAAVRAAMEARAAIDEQADNDDDAAWDPALIAGGEMLADEQQFRDYVRRAKIIGRGTLIEWGGQTGIVRVKSLLAGSLADDGGRSVPLVYSGGFVRVKTGDDVLFLLAHKKGELRLHSLCAAAGLFSDSERLAALVARSLTQEARASQ